MLVSQRTHSAIAKANKSKIIVSDTKNFPRFFLYFDI